MRCYSQIFDSKLLPICWEYLQLGMLMPQGIPLPANVSTSKEVKSGLWNVSFSNSLGHGNFGNSSSARSTSTENFFDISLLTMATNPSNSPRLPCGSLYVSMKPMYLRMQNHNFTNLFFVDWGERKKICKKPRWYWWAIDEIPTFQ